MTQTFFSVNALINNSSNHKLVQHLLRKSVNIQNKDDCKNNVSSLKTPFEHEKTIFFWAKIDLQKKKTEYTIARIQFKKQTLAYISIEQNGSPKLWKLIVAPQYKDSTMVQKSMKATKPNKWFFIQISYDAKLKILKVGSMFDISKNNKPEELSMPTYDLKGSDLSVSCDFNKVLYKGTVANLGFTRVPFKSSLKKIMNIAQYGFGEFNLILPFRLNHINSYRSVIVMERDKKSTIGYAYKSKGSHKIIYDLASPFYADYDERINSRPFINRGNELMVKRVSVNNEPVLPETGLYKLSIVLELSVNKLLSYESIEEKTKNRYNYDIYKLIDKGGKNVVKIAQIMTCDCPKTKKIISSLVLKIEGKMQIVVKDLFNDKKLNDYENQKFLRIEIDIWAENVIIKKRKKKVLSENKEKSKDENKEKSKDKKDNEKTNNKTLRNLSEKNTKPDKKAEKTTKPENKTDKKVEEKVTIKKKPKKYKIITKRVTRASVRINHKMFKRKIKSYIPNPKDKHIIGTQRSQKGFARQYHLYDYNLFTISNGQPLNANEILPFNKNLNENLTYIVGKNTIYESSC